ncbi:DUF6069 family protein [Kutzneria viridogrisea]|uniref:Uncharacterized protein n=2 Tax=Kutzneria TaxID=43356 RepID=W5VZW4_9PSEU|nr:DUF6069 family protein [Kutzneria albida]AHH93821.1 hypothetical protein KALB_444 [Kutzneria albida DSM 43870]MBA8931174.1 hypothetical protein [Kutzneria viridogrisea]
MTDYGDAPITVQSGRLWAGAAATALVAGLISIVGILIGRGLVHAEVLAPKGDGVWGGANTVTYAIVSAAIALLAAGLLHLLLLTTPRATTFFTWIMVLLTLIAVVLPLSLPVNWDSKITTGLINLVIGLVITGILTGLAPSAVRMTPPPPHRPREDYDETVEWPDRRR